MDLIFNFPKNSEEVENEVSYIRANLMQRYIDSLEFSDTIKQDIKECLIEKLQET